MFAFIAAEIMKLEDKEYDIMNNFYDVWVVIEEEKAKNGNGKGCVQTLVDMGRLLARSRLQEEKSKAKVRRSRSISFFLKIK